MAPASAKKGNNNGQGAENSQEVNLQILSVNDFHGSITTSSNAFSPSSSFSGMPETCTPVGRADFLAANMGAAEAEADNSTTVSAGDPIGASPLISALFHDEPTIEAMNLIGLDINGVGNHEFDEGAAELLRMQNAEATPMTATWTATDLPVSTSSSLRPTLLMTLRAKRSSRATPSRTIRASRWRSLA